MSPDHPASPAGTPDPAGGASPARPASAAGPAGPAAVAACERTFRRHGLPTFVDSHSVRRDVFGRAAPLLLVILLLELAAAIRLDWAPWVNVLVVLGAAAVIAAGYAGLNVLRARPWGRLPQDVGTPELTFFVLGPAIPPLLAGGQWLTAVGIAAGNVLLLALIRAVVGYGLHATLAWGLVRVFSELGGSLVRLVRFLPLLLIFSLALFYSTEVWQVFEHTTRAADYLIAIFFGALILLILTARLSGESDHVLSEATSRSGLSEPFADLSRAQRRNVKAMVWLSQVVQVLVVSAGMWAFFLFVGVLTVTGPVMGDWHLDGGVQLLEVTIADGHFILTRTLLRVTTAIATFTGVYYAVSILTDAVYRDDFVADMSTKMAEVAHTREAYAEALSGLRSQGAS